MCDENTSEIRRFSLEMLDILDWYYEWVNRDNVTRYNKYMERRRKQASGIFAAIGYGISCIGKAFAVARGAGHLVTFETFSAYQERKLSNMKHNFVTEYSIYVTELGLKMPEAIRNTREAIEKDDRLLHRFYHMVMKYRHHQDILKPLQWAILACDVTLPFKRSDWDRYFRITENVVAKDSPGFDFVTRFRNAYRKHDERMKNEEYTHE